MEWTWNSFDEFFDELEKRAVDFFLEEVNPQNGAIRDRNTGWAACSISSVGMGLIALCIGVERGYVSREQAKERVLKVLTFLRNDALSIHGFYYHFLDMETGKRVWNCELSSIDTAFLIAGALFAGDYFLPDTEIYDLADALYRDVDWQWMMDGGTTLSMGWFPAHGFLKARWNKFSEHMFTYILAFASPGNAISEKAWDAFERPLCKRRGQRYFYCYTESLFTYVFSQMLIDFRHRKDKYTNYWENSRNAILSNREFVIRRQKKVPGYDEWTWGLTECDGPDGYVHHGASWDWEHWKWRHDGTIAPYAMVCSVPFIPEIAEKSINETFRKYGDKIWNKYGFTSGFNVKEDWYSTEHTGIHTGASLIMIENHRTGFVWEQFMKNRYVQRGCQLAGLLTNDQWDEIEGKS